VCKLLKTARILWKEVASGALSRRVDDKIWHRETIRGKERSMLGHASSVMLGALDFLKCWSGALGDHVLIGRWNQRDVSKASKHFTTPDHSQTSIQCSLRFTDISAAQTLIERGADGNQDSAKE
jgi:hypothetical protein